MFVLNALIRLCRLWKRGSTPLDYLTAPVALAVTATIAQAWVSRLITLLYFNYLDVKKIKIGESSDGRSND